MGKTTTFQDRIDEAIRRCSGNQSELARRIRDRFGVDVKAQTIQYLADRSREKPATGSRLLPQIAAVTGLNSEWLATGRGSMDDPRYSSPENVGNPFSSHSDNGRDPTKAFVQLTEPRYHAAPITRHPDDVQRPTIINGMEYTSDALEVAQAFMSLPKNVRDSVKAQIVAEAERYSAPLTEKDVPRIGTGTRRDDKPQRRTK